MRRCAKNALTNPEKPYLCTASARMRLRHGKHRTCLGKGVASPRKCRYIPGHGRAYLRPCLAARASEGARAAKQRS